MKTYHHERVEHENPIPAMIAVLEEKDIKHFFSSDIFIPPHWHRSLEICLIEHAQISLQIGEQETLIEDDFTCVNSGVVHSLRAKIIKEQPCCIILVISYDFIKQYYPELDQVTFDLSMQSDHSELKQLYQKLKDLYLNQDTYTYMDITACIFNILSHLFRYYSKVQPINEQSQKNQEKIKEILNYLHENYAQELTLSGVAEAFHMNKDYFSRQFHHYVGTTFRDYVSSYRLYKAYHDVIETTMTIQDIARKHGFFNVRSFIKTFSDVYHETPMKYRKSQHFDMK